MKIVIFTSSELRHTYVARKIIEAFPESVAKIYCESRTYVPREVGKTKEDKEILDWHFNLRDKMERRFFSAYAKKGFGKIPVRTLPYGALSEEEIRKELTEIKPDVIAVFGTSVIKDSIIDVFPGKIINLHLGLSPYYRGSGTNFWALYNEEPEYVGATVHFLDKGIDTGNIIHHARPDIEEGDNQHSIGCKTIIAGADALIRTIRELGEGTATSHKQWKEGTRPFCYRKNFTPEAVRKLKNLFDGGLIQRYLSRKDTVHNNFKTIP